MRRRPRGQRPKEVTHLLAALWACPRSALRPITQAPHPALYGVFFVKRKNAFSSRRLGCALRLGVLRLAAAPTDWGVENDGLSAPPWRRSEAGRFPHPRSRGAAIGSARRRREGNHAAGAQSSRHNLVFGGPRDPDHDALMRIGGGVPRRRTILSLGAKAMAGCGSPPPRIVCPARADARSRREKEAPFQERTGEAESSFAFGRSMSALTPGRTARRRPA